MSKHAWVEVPFESALLLLRLGWTLQYNDETEPVCWLTPWGLINKQIPAEEYKKFAKTWRARPKETE